MRIWNNFIRKLKRALPSWSPTDDRWYYPGGLFLGGYEPTKAGTDVNEYTALNYSAVFSAISLIAGTIGSLPLHLYKLNDKGKEKAFNHPLYDVLHSKANPYMTAMNYREAAAAHVVSWGNSYSEIGRDRAGRVTSLWLITPNRVTLKPDRTYEINLGTKKVYLPRESVLHIPGLGFDGYVGYSVLSMARESIALGLATEEFGARWFGSGTHPGTVVCHPGKLSQEAHDNLKRSLTEKYSGLGKAHKLLLLEEGMKIEKLGFSPEDSQFLATRQFQIPEIARWFNVPCHKLHDMTKSSFCLPADVEVFTENGPKSVAEIEQGEKVWSLGDDGLFKLAKVTCQVYSGDDEILTIKTTNRTIRSNSRHRFLVRRKYDDPQPGVGGNNKKSWRNEWVSAGELKVGDTLVVLDNLPNTANIKRIGNRDITNEFMEFCGLLMGDGNIISVPGTQYITIARANQASYMDYYRNIMRKLFTKGGYRYHGQENHPLAKLTNSQVAEIREKGKYVFSNMDLARRYNVNICAIQSIVHGRKYDFNDKRAGLSKDQIIEIRTTFRFLYT